MIFSNPKDLRFDFEEIICEENNLLRRSFIKIWHLSYTKYT